MNRRFLFGAIGGIGLILTTLLSVATISADDSRSQIDILKTITSTSIRTALESSRDVDEIAARVGVKPDELRRICLALKIDLPTPPVPQKTAPEPVPAPSAPIAASTPKTPGALNTDVILDYQGESPYILLVDKAEHILYLLRYENGKRVVEATFPCKTGKREGDKQERGDHRTPEGIYFFQTRYTRQEIEQRVGKPNAYQYGELAFTTDFPNRIDQLKGKNGGGIWLHGTDEPFESTPFLDTRGCVVTTNDTIKKLSKYIEIDRTPMVIVDRLITRSESEIDGERQSILTMLEGWRSSWSRKQIEEYIRFYSSSFSSQGLSREAWKSRKEGLSRINGNVSIKLENISILKQKDGMVVRFIQDYTAENVANVGVKTLYLIQGSNGWEIVSEHFRRTN